MKVKMLTPCGLKVLPPESKQGIKAEFPWVGKKIRISREGLSPREGTFSFNWLKDRSNSSVRAILDSCGVSYFLVIVTKPHDNLQKARYLASGSRGLRLLPQYHKGIAASVRYGSRSRKLGAHILNHKQEGELEVETSRPVSFP